MIYLQKNPDENIPSLFDTACAMYGAIDEGLSYKLITYDDVKNGKYDLLIRKNLFVGSVEFMQMVFSRVGLEDVRLPMNSNRKSITMKLNEAKSLINVFIKPKHIKLFTGLVLDGCSYPILNTFDGETEVLVYDVIHPNIVSEWRVYVNKNKILDSHFYSGELTIHPDYTYVLDVINKNKEYDFPDTYVIDIGILLDNKNIVIEYNDMWAIGNYGMPNYLYLMCLKERYFQIVK